MRTTLELPEALWRGAKEHAARHGSTLTAVVEAALRSYLRRKPAPPRPSFRWHVEKGKLLPGVDINSRSALLDYLDGQG